jgi:hypothetical protein
VKSWEVVHRIDTVEFGVFFWRELWFLFRFFFCAGIWDAYLLVVIRVMRHRHGLSLHFWPILSACTVVEQLSVHAPRRLNGNSFNALDGVWTRLTDGKCKYDARNYTTWPACYKQLVSKGQGSMQIDNVTLQTTAITVFSTIGSVCVRNNLADIYLFYLAGLLNTKPTMYLSRALHPIFGRLEGWNSLMLDGNHRALM